MAILIFKLRYVPDDEAQDVRELLGENDIDYYETSAGVLGISMPGLWIRNEEQAEKARQLIDAYQQQRQKKAREDFEANPKTIFDMFLDNPIRYLSFILAIVLVCFLMVFSFFKL